MKTYKIKDVAQIRLLADPLKLQLLQAFAEKARTTKDVASDLGESVTKLYRHVDALHDAGLLEIAEEKQKRGTIERTFRAIAERFEADHALFVDDEGEDAPDAAREILRAAETEILEALATCRDDSDEQGLLMRMRCKASPERIGELRQSLQQWCDSVQQDDDCSDDDKSREVGALIAFYPVD